MGVSEFASVSITGTKVFSWVFMTDWILTMLLTVGFIFYFNRLVGIILTFALKLTLWRSQKVKIDVQSVKLSFLGGRLFFRNLTIIDQDHTVSALQGSLTWRYWLPNVRRQEMEAMANEVDPNIEMNSKLPSRFILEIDGLEIFVYNRTVSYNNILKTLFNDKPEDQDSTKEPYDIFADSENSFSLDSSEEISNGHGSGASPILKLLPLTIKVNKGAVVAGNKTTSAVLILSYTSLDGVLDLKGCENALDCGRESFDFSLDRPKMSLKPNILYDRELNGGVAPTNSKTKRFSGQRWYLFRSVIHLVNSLSKKNSQNKSDEAWKGLAQYLDGDTEPIQETRGEDIEYAKYTSIISADKCNINYYYDLPGVAPTEHLPTINDIEVGNGGSAPKFGLDIDLQGATVYYGPWAERQRGSLHQMLMPTICRDGVPQRVLKPGETRVYTRFDFNVTFTDDLILRIPIREFSKNEEFHHNADMANLIRSFGWVELKAGKNSNVFIETGLVASNTGYKNNMELFLADLEARSSVNHDIFLRAKEHSISADIGYPLSWNGHTIWSFLNNSKDLETYLLREHITLLSDLFTDFATGTPTPYEMFRPFTYDFEWHVDSYQLYFNVNDANIVNNPLDFNDNCYLSMQGDVLDVSVSIPLDSVVKKSTTIDYLISTPSFSLVLDTPPWHTLNNFLKNNVVGRSGDFSISGSYTYYPEVGLDLVETIIIACKGKHIVLECYGFVVKYLMSVKENYFGDFTKFRTLEEYTSSLDTGETATTTSSDSRTTNTIHENAEKNEAPGKRKENEIDVHFSFCTDESCIVLPSNNYDCSTNFSLHLNSFQLDIRFTNYYMDLQADISPVKGYYVIGCDSSRLLDISSFELPPEHQLSIRGLSIHGHRMFGIPPLEPTYFCKWDITPQSFGFSGTSQALHGLLSSFVKLGFGYKNLENELLIDEPELFDITNLTVVLPEVSIEIKEPDLENSVKFEIQNLALKFIDFPNNRYTKKISLDIEEIRLSVTARDNSVTLLDVKTALKITDFCNDQDYEAVKQKRNKHVSSHDGPFHRIPFFAPSESSFAYNQSFRSLVPSFSLPDGIPAITKNTIDSIFEDMGIDDLLYDDSSSFGDTRDSRDSRDDFFQDFGDDKLPQSFKSSSKYWSSVSGVYMKPISEYDDKDFRPSKAADPAYETDDIVINMGVLDGNISIASLFVLLKYAERFITVSIEDVLDKLHLAVLKKLFVKVHQKAKCVNIAFITPEINLKLRETCWSASSSFEKADHVSLRIKSPSLTLSNLSGLNDISQNTFTFHFGTLDLEIVAQKKESIVLGLVLEDFEAWSDKTSKQVSSVTLKDVSIHIDHTENHWLFKFIVHFADLMKNFSKEAARIHGNSRRAQAELVYQVAIASTLYRIEHDPAVITRPAYIIRLSKRHIRANDSWKVIARLRHIFDNLPSEWKIEHVSRYLRHDERAPDTAMVKVLEVFTDWRSWEFADIANSFIFRFVFSAEAEKDKVPLVVDLSLATVRLGLSSVSEPDTQLELGELEFSVSISSNTATQYQKEGAAKWLKCLSFQAGSISGKFSQLILKLPFEELSEYFAVGDTKAPISTIAAATAKVSEAVLVQLEVLVDQLDLSLDFYGTVIAVTGNDILSEILLTEDAGIKCNSTILRSKSFKLAVGSPKASLIEYSSSNLVLNFAKRFGIQTEIVNCGLSLDQSFLQIGQSSASVNDFIINSIDSFTSVKNDLTYFLNKDNQRVRIQNGKSLIGKFSLNSNVFKWSIGAIDPFKIGGATERLSLSVMLTESLVTFSIDAASSLLDISLHNDARTLLQSTQKLVTFILKCSTSNKALNIDLGCGSAVTFTPDIVSRVEFFKRGVDLATSNIRLLTTSFKKMSSVLFKPKRSAEAKDEFLYWVESAGLSSDYVAIGVEVGSSIYSLEFQKVTVQLFDIVFNNKKKPTGEVAVESTHFLVRNKDVSSDVSTLVDVNYKLKVNNDKGGKSQSLQIESSYSRFVVHPLTIIRLLQLVNDVEYIVSVMSLGETPSSPKPSTSSSSFDLFGYFSSISVLSYNSCVGFLFNKHEQNSSGLIAGCDRVFIILEGSLGKLSLVNAYLSIAKGDTSSTFYSLGSEAEGANRAFLPNMQITYAIRKLGNNKDIQVRATGDELDVRFVSTSITFIDQCFKSIAIIEKMKETLIIYPSHFVSRPAPSTSPDAYIPSDVTSVDCFMDFAGGLVKIYRLEDFQTPVDDIFKPSFELRAPAVKVGAGYSKTSGLKDHKLTVEVFTFSSSNTLYSTCVPILFDIWDSMKHIGGGTTFKTQSKQQDTHQQDFDIAKILSKVQLNLSLHIDKQELTLSCEPSAKVQAVVGIESIHFGIVSNEDDPKHPISGTLDIRKLGASLQHSFSREISGSVGLERLLVITFLGVEPLKAFIAGKLDTVDMYLNLKQLQDVDLFRDLWLPKHLYKKPSNVKTLNTVSGDNNLVFQFQKVSTTNLIPWDLNFIISSVAMEVDLGQSLGVLSLNLNKFWAISRKVSDRHQDLVIGVNEILLSSSGRLGGHLTVTNIRSRSVIRWSFDGEKYDVPLVSLSFGFDSIEAKASFDYNVFLILKVLKSDITVFNQVDKDKQLGDKLVAITSCESIEVFITTLAAANILDIQNSISRIRQDNKVSYKEDLKTVIGKDNLKKAMDVFDVIATLRTELEVDFGKVLLHVYPGSLLDSQVLVIDIGGMNAEFSQKTINEKVETSLKLVIKDISVSLSTYKKQLSEELINSITVDEFVAHSVNAKGGSIFVFPSLECRMQTWSTPNPSIIEYIYKSSFGGKVDIRWNLGSISFIREMWLVHAKALASRMPQRVKSHTKELPIIEEKLKEVELGTKYRYVPLETPIIEAPQLKELGDATPPLEWFGLHRQSFPGLTHQLVIVGLQKTVHEVEMQYGRVLGKA